MHVLSGPWARCPRRCRSSRSARCCRPPSRPRLTRRYGARALITAGMLTTTVGFLVLAPLDVHRATIAQHAGLAALGVGLGLAMPPATTAILESLPPALHGVASASNDLARELGAVLGIAAFATTSTSVHRINLVAAGPPSAERTAALDSLPAALTLSPPLPAEAAHAATTGFLVTLTATSARTLATAGIALLLLRTVPSR
ncbi:MFS transporter [Kitasatospora sp. NPDC096147]|uniref:MFS transporter n=1 Tax=Kitasatospora sp. NPDC096147 TaxID=3364093 RepID=UPI003809A9D3